MKTVRTIFLISAILLFLGNMAEAQQEYYWEQYKIAMTLPSDFKVVRNTDTEFECDGQGMHLYMYFFEDEKVNFDDMVKETRDLAKKLKFEVTDEMHNFKDDEGFEGRYVLGYKDGKQIMLCGMLNSKTAANFWVIIEYEDNDPVAEKDGLAILNSIRQK